MGTLYFVNIYVAIRNFASIFCVFVKNTDSVPNVIFAFY